MDPSDRAVMGGLQRRRPHPTHYGKDRPTNPGDVSSCGYRRHPHGNPHVRYRGMGKTLENTLKAGINTKLPTCDAEGVFHDNEGTLDVKGVKISIAADIW